MDSPAAVYPSRRNVPTMTDFGTVSAPEKSEQPLIRLSKHMACHAPKVAVPILIGEIVSADHSILCTWRLARGGPRRGGRMAAGDPDGFGYWIRKPPTMRRAALKLSSRYCRVGLRGRSPQSLARPGGNITGLTMFPGAKKETAMKRCAQCHGKLGLGVRSRILWNGRWWIHVRYCSTHCEALHGLERRQRQTSLAHTFLSRSSPQS